MHLKKRPLPDPHIGRALFPAKYEYPHFQDVSKAPFEVKAAGFSRANAWWLAEASLLSYWPQEDIRRAIERIQTGATMQPFEGDNLEGFVASFSRFAIVAFRGTEATSVGDIFTDLRTTKDPWPLGGKVHEGFCEAFEDVWPDAGKNIPNDRTIWFTGHSLGGALATLAADRFVADGGAARYGGVYTVGSPMVGDRNFVDGFNQRHPGKSFRVVNDQDGVPTVPPTLWGFRHVNDEHSVGADDPVNRLVERIVDHTPSRYAILIWNQLVDEAPCAT